MFLHSKEQIENKAIEVANDFKKLNPILIGKIDQLHPNAYIAIAKYFFASGSEYATFDKVVPIEELK